MHTYISFQLVYSRRRHTKYSVMIFPLYFASICITRWGDAQNDIIYKSYKRDIIIKTSAAVISDNLLPFYAHTHIAI